MGDIVSTVGIDWSVLILAGGEVTIWDFAGQLEYTTTHQFFLSTEVCNIQSLELLCLIVFYFMKV